MSRFEVLILGNSSALPAYGRHPSAQLINIHEHYVLIDCGEGTQDRLAQYHTKAHKIELIFISHLHGDHYFGLPGLLTSMNLTGRKNPLDIYCPVGLDKLIDLIQSFANSALGFEIRWHILNVTTKEKIFEDSVKKIYAFPLKHRVPTFGFLIEEKPGKRVFLANKFPGELPSFELIKKLKEGQNVLLENGTLLTSVEYTDPPLPPKSYAYCSDTVFDSSITNYFRQTDLLYHEATYTQEHAPKALENFHSTAAQAATIAKLSQSQKLMIGHFSSRYKNPEVLLHEAQSIFPQTSLAIEGLWVTV